MVITEMVYTTEAKTYTDAESEKTLVYTDAESEKTSLELKKTSDNSLATQNAKVEKSVQEICEKFKMELMRCVNCPVLMQCKYPQKRLEALREEAKKISEAIYKEETELDDSADNTLRAQNKRDYIYKSYIESHAYEVLQNDRCIYERKEILNVLQKFVDAGYDITDPRAHLVLNELLGNILNSGRSNKAFTSLGVLLKKETPSGPIYYQNPLLKTKMEFSKIIIEAIEALDRMLKSDETIKSDKNFTTHLLKELKIRESQKKKITSGTLNEGFFGPKELEFTELDENNLKT